MGTRKTIFVDKLEMAVYSQLAVMTPRNRLNQTSHLRDICFRFAQMHEVDTRIEHCRYLVTLVFPTVRNSDYYLQK